MIRSVLAASLAILPLGLAAQTPAERGSGAELRVLDKSSGTVSDLKLPNGGSARVGRMNVELGECRYPPGNRQGEAYAWVSVSEGSDSVFQGWMIGSSPALNGMDHPRYDIWVMRCSN